MKYEIKNQLSVAIENTPATIASLGELLANHDVSLNAITLSDTESKGRFRFTANDHQAAKRTLEKNGYQVAAEEVIAIRLQDSKGRLAFLTKALARGGINIDYMYASVDEQGTNSHLIVKVSNIHLAVHILEEILVAA